jgi:DNA primase
MRYSDDQIEEVRSQNDIVDVISGYVQLKKRGSDYVGLCPFHNEKTPSFSVSRSKQMYHCFGCGAGGNVITFVMQYENLGFVEALRSLADRAGIALPEPKAYGADQEALDRRAQLLEIQKQAAMYYYAKLIGKNGADGMAYLKKRALSDETIRHFGLGFSGRTADELYRYLKRKKFSDELLAASGLFRMEEKRGGRDKFWNRVMFPIMDVRNRVIGFGGRVMGQGEPKYLNSPETEIFDKSRNLYGLCFARRSRRNGIILCEGYMDVIAMHQAGFDNAVASLGTSLTSGHCSLLKRYTQQVLLLYDSDGAGVRAALRAIPMLREAGIHSAVVHLDPYKDPDEFIKAEGAEAFSERLENAENSFLFTVRMMERDYDRSDPQGRSDFLHAAAQKVLELEDPVTIEEYSAEIAKRYGVEKQLFLSLVKQESLRAVHKKPVAQPEQLQRRKSSADQAEERAQRELIGWEASCPELISLLSQYVQPEDFEDPFYESLLRLLQEQQKKGSVRPAALLNHFEDPQEQQRAAAALAPNPLPEDAGERERAILDLVCRIRRNGIDRRMKEIDFTDAAAFQILTEQRKDLDVLMTEGFPAHVRQGIAALRQTPGPSG